MQVLKQNPKNSQELWNVVHSSWAEICLTICQKLVDSMQCRCQAVFKNNGYETVMASMQHPHTQTDVLLA